MTWQRAFRWALLLVIAVFPMAVLRANLRRHEPSAVDRTLLRITAPVQRLVTWGAQGAQSLWFGYINLVDTETENGELREENRRLHSQLAELTERVSDVERLEKLLAFNAGITSPRLGARVIASAMDARQRVVRIAIDRGQADVRIGMPVIAVGGVVGRVTRALDTYADVMLISDPTSALDVVIPRTESRGVLRGTASEDRYLCQVEWVESDTQTDRAPMAPEVGDEVVTSGFGGVFPAGLKVGRVASVRRRPYSLFHDIEVAPVVDFAALRAVSVILAAPLVQTAEQPTTVPFLPRPL